MASTRILEFNTLLMNSTFKIYGPGEKTGEIELGTSFLVGKPAANEPTTLLYVLVTAAHVLENIHGPEAFLSLRTQKPDGTFSQFPHKIQIRNGELALWTKHPYADVAAMYVTLPWRARADLVSANLLADDAKIEELEIHPGDELMCLGFPLGIGSNDANFPILRSGKIASYPLLPTKKTKTFLLDFEVFKGNSGGPAYYVYQNRYYGGDFHLGNFRWGIIGLISGERLEKVVSAYEVKLNRMAIAEVVHASLIKETVGMLPDRMYFANPPRKEE